MTIQVDALPDDDEWMGKAAAHLEKAGFQRAGLDELRRNPRKACLKYEPGKGVGFLGHGVWNAGTFGCWYVGLDRAYGIGRYSVALQNGTGGYCDGEANRMLPLDWLIGHGLGGAFVNGENSGCFNLELFKSCCFEHKGLIWIPMGVKLTFVDAYGVWKYNHLAANGCGRIL